MNHFKSCFFSFCVGVVGRGVVLLCVGFFFFFLARGGIGRGGGGGGGGARLPANMKRLLVRIYLN